MGDRDTTNTFFSFKIALQVTADFAFQREITYIRLVPVSDD